MTINIKSAPGGVLVELSSDEGGRTVVATEYVPTSRNDDSPVIGATVAEVIEALEVASDLSPDLPPLLDNGDVVWFGDVRDWFERPFPDDGDEPRIDSQWDERDEL